MRVLTWSPRCLSGQITTFMTSPLIRLVYPKSLWLMKSMAGDGPQQNLTIGVNETGAAPTSANKFDLNILLPSYFKVTDHPPSPGASL